MISYHAHLADEAVAIFLFHGVIPSQRHEVRNYTRKHLPADDFSRVLDNLTAYGQPVSMPEVVRWLAGDGELPSRAFAITFDDGFANNLAVAAPLLERRSVPATFYVTTHFVEANATSWIDQIEAAIAAAPAVQIDMPALPLTACAGSASEKRSLLNQIRTIVKARPDLDPYEVADDIVRQVGGAAPYDADLDAKMAWPQVRELHGHPLFTVGGHGHTHRVLAFLTPAALREEVSRSISLLEAHLREPVRHYSYPEGLANCYSDDVIAELRGRGVVCSPTAEVGINRRGDDPFRLKRIMVA